MVTPNRASLVVSLCASATRSTLVALPAIASASPIGSAERFARSSRDMLSLSDAALLPRELMTGAGQRHRRRERGSHVGILREVGQAVTSGAQIQGPQATT